MKKLKSKLAWMLGCIILIAQMPTTFVNATEINTEQEINAEVADNSETTINSTQETQIINGETIWTESADNKVATYQVQSNITDETNLMSNSSTVEAVQGTEDSVKLIIENGVLTGFTGSPVYVTIPEGVTSIGAGAFIGCISLKSVIIPEGVTSIEVYAFCGCSNLQSLKIADSVTSISAYVFDDCDKLADENGYIIFNKILCKYTGLETNVIIPDGVTSIGDSAFDNNINLKSVIIKDGVTSIGGRAFYECHELESVTIADSVTSIGANAFTNCGKLTDKNGFIIVKGILCNYSGLDTNVTIPDGVTSIGNNAFEVHTNLESIIIADSVTSIGSMAFFECTKLQSITIPDGVTKIAGGAFYGCTNLQSITIPDSVTEIESGAFYKCNDITIFCNNNSYAYTYATINSIAASILVEVVNLNENILNLATGQTTTLAAIVLPDNAANKNVIWSSSDINIATVDSTGKVTAVSVGTATITVTTEDGNKTASCTINVKQIEIVESVSVESVSINESTLNFATGQATTLTAKVLPDNAINKNITWSSSNKNVATVDSTGKVTAVSAGTATITVTTEDGNKIATCNVNVSILVHTIKLNATKVTLGKKAKIKLKATTSPEDATSANVTWTSSNTNVATVSSEGIVKAIALGTADITATAQDGSNVTNTCKVTVSKNKSYTIKYKLNKGQNADLNPSYYPIKTKLKLQNPTRKGYTFAGWYVGDKKITLIDKKTTGKITVTAKWEKTSVDKTTIKKAKNNQAGSIAVFFGKVSGAKGYTVYYSTNKKLKNASKIEANSKKKSATITNLEKGTTYYVIVKAYKTDSGGNRVYGKTSKTSKVKIKK